MTADFNKMLVTEIPRMRGYALALARNKSVADDLLQETAFKAWKARDQFELGTNFKAWLYRILRNEYLSTCRRSKRAPVPMDDLPQEFFGRDGDQETNTLTREVFHAMDRLSKDQREALLLKYASGFSYDEVAHALGCTVGTVKSRLWRARNEMQQFFFADEAPSPSGKHVNRRPETSRSLFVRDAI